MNSDKYDLPYGIRSYCSGVWNSSTQSFEKGDDIQCCLDSCKKHLNFCFDTCNKAEQIKQQNCFEECQDLVENCESVCLEGSSRKIGLSMLENKGINKGKKKGINIILFIVIAIITLFFLVLILSKLKK